MKPPIFVVFGMPRAGTTYLFHTLSKHPLIFMPYRKESHYFSVNYSKGADWYLSLYKDMNSDQIGADVNPQYYIDNQTVERILAYDKNTKVILSVRDPVEFAISLHGNMQTLGWVVPNVAEMIHGYNWPLSKEESVSMVLANRFMENKVKELQAAFGDNLLMYDFALFQDSPLRVLKALESFLDLPPYFNESNVEDIKINATGRRNIPFFNKLIRSEKFLGTIYKITPDPLIRKGRSLFDRLSVSTKGSQSSASTLSKTEQKKLEEALSSDRTFYENLFSNHRILLGSGDSFLK